MFDIRAATHQAQALAAAGRLDDAAALHRRIVAAHPDSGVAQHNLAACLGDDGRWTEAEPAARAAIARGLQAAETGWCLAARIRLRGDSMRPRPRC